MEPLDRSTIWPYDDAEPGEFFYQRYGSPTVAAAEAALGELEGGTALLFPSGAGATTALVLALLEPGQSSRDRAGRLLRDDRHARAPGPLGPRSTSSSTRPDRRPTAPTSSGSSRPRTRCSRCPTSRPRPRTPRRSSWTPPPRRPSTSGRSSAARTSRCTARRSSSAGTTTCCSARSSAAATRTPSGCVSVARPAGDRGGARPCLAAPAQPQDAAGPHGAAHRERDRARAPARGARRPSSAFATRASAG